MSDPRPPLPAFVVALPKLQVQDRPRVSIRSSLPAPARIRVDLLDLEGNVGGYVSGPALDVLQQSAWDVVSPELWYARIVGPTEAEAAADAPPATWTATLGYLHDNALG